MSYRDEPKEHWEAALKEIEKKQYFRDEAKALYTTGGLKDGEIFIVKGGTGDNGNPQWACAVFIASKMIYAHYDTTDRRIETLKLKAVAHLLDVVKRGFADTKQAPWLPPRVQNIKNPDIIIYGAKSNQKFDEVIESGKEQKIVKEQDEVIEELQDVPQE